MSSSPDVGPAATQVASDLDACLTAVPAALIGAESAAEARRIVAVLPSLSGGVSLECNLDEAEPSMDLILRASRADSGNFHNHALFATTRCGQFMAAWQQRHCSLAQTPYVDLEWDHGTGPEHPYLTLMFHPGLPHGLGAIRAVSRQGAGGSGLGRDAEQLLDILATSGASVSEPLCEQVRRSHAVLPEDGYICHVGLLMERRAYAKDCLRFIVSLPNTRGALTQYLSATEWGGDVDRLWHLQQRFCAQVNRIDLDIDVEDNSLGTRVALYSTFYRPGPGDRSVARVLSRLDSDHLMVGGKRKALEAWLTTTPPTHHDRSLTVKVSLDRKGRARSKAYLSALSSFKGEPRQMPAA